MNENITLTFLHCDQTREKFPSKRAISQRFNLMINIPPVSRDVTMNPFHCLKGLTEPCLLLACNLVTHPRRPQLHLPSQNCRSDKIFLTRTKTLRTSAVTLFYLSEILELSCFKCVYVLLTLYKPTQVRTPLEIEPVRSDSFISSSLDHVRLSDAEKSSQSARRQPAVGLTWFMLGEVGEMY